MAKGQSAARSHEPAPGTKWFQDKEGRVWYEKSFGEWQEASPTHCDSYGDLADDQGATTPGGHEWPAWRDGASQQNSVNMSKFMDQKEHMEPQALLLHNILGSSSQGHSHGTSEKKSTDDRKGSKGKKEKKGEKDKKKR